MSCKVSWYVVDACMYYHHDQYIGEKKKKEEYTQRD